MKEDYEFVKRVLRNTDNKMVHYPAIRQLINNFEIKWKRIHGDSMSLKRYEYHLKTLFENYQSNSLYLNFLSLYELLCPQYIILTRNY